jgi:hypothetical protein
MVRSCHIPVWDVVFGLEKDGNGAGGGGRGAKTERKEEEEEEKVGAGGGGGGGGALWGCGGNLHAILCSAKRLRADLDGPTLLDSATMHSNYINMTHYMPT